MNKVFAILLMFVIGALGFILHCVHGVLMVAWMIRHPTRWLDRERYRLRYQKSF